MVGLLHAPESGTLSYVYAQSFPTKSVFHREKLELVILVSRSTVYSDSIEIRYLLF
jgi:hypothetical protein